MDGKVLVSLVIATVFINLANGVDYCNIASCKSKGPHTMCKYQSGSVSSACTGTDQLGGTLTQNEKNAILNKHNQLRQKVARGDETRGRPGPQPAARDIGNLQWDNELATIAQTWANQCQFGHDSCRNVESFSVGQNIYQKGTSGDPNSLDALMAMVQGWYDEVKDFDRNQVNKFTNSYATNGEQVGHYTQLVWAKTTKLGCGARSFKNGRTNDRYLVCNYGPSGNVLGRPIYTPV